MGSMTSQLQTVEIPWPVSLGVLRANVTKCIGIAILQKMGIFFHMNHFLEALNDQIVMKIGTQPHMDII